MRKYLWQEVAQDLARMVSVGQWPVGEIIPREVDLARQFNVSRDTMRRAFAELERQGLFVRTQHVGTRVVSRSLSTAFLHEISSLSALDDYSSTYPRIIKKTEVIEMTGVESERTGFAQGAKKFRFENIRVDPRHHEETVVVTYVYIEEDLAGVVEPLAKERPYDLIALLVEEASGVECMEIRQTVFATAMPVEAANLFHLPQGVPALVIARNYLNEHAECMVASISYHPADNYAFQFSAKKPHSGRLHGKARADG